MSVTSVISRLKKSRFEAVQCWDNSYQVKINKQISGLPQHVAESLTADLNEIFEAHAKNLEIVYTDKFQQELFDNEIGQPDKPVPEEAAG